MLEGPPPPPRPAPSPRPRPRARAPFLFGTSKNLQDEFELALSRCPEEININFNNTLSWFVDEGIVTDRYLLLRGDESFKQSWEKDLSFPIAYEYSWYARSKRSVRKKVRWYMNYAARHNYFDVQDPKYRPRLLHMGPFVIYPEGQTQTDPIFEQEPTFMEGIPRLISSLGEGALEYHNFMTGSKLRLTELVKANALYHYYGQVYFITLKAFDELSEKEVTCQSRVLCHGKHIPGLRGKDARATILDTLVQSFRIVPDTTTK